MRGYKQIARRVLWIAGILFVLALLSAFFLPRIVNLDLLKSEIQNAISQAVGGSVSYQRMDLGYFPAPHLTVHKGTYFLAGGLSGKFDSLSVYPGILPLLAGNFTINKLAFVAPETTLVLQKKTGDDAETAAPASLKILKDIFRKRQDFMVSLIDSNRVYDIKNGKFLVYKGKRAFIRFRDVNATLNTTGKQLDWEIRCGSNLFDNMSFNETIASKPLRASGNMELKGIHPETITEAFFPDAVLKIGDSRLDMNLSFETDRLGTFKAGADGAISHLTLTRGREKMVIKNGLVKGTVRADDKSISISLDSLHLDAPKLNLSGEFLMDRKRPKMKLAIKGKTLDIDSIRQAAFFASGEAVAIKNIFERVKGGRITSFEIMSEGKTTADLVDVNNIHIKGHIVDGEIRVPEANLDLTEVSGEAAFSSGILEGKNLASRIKDMLEDKDGTTRLVDTHGQNGTFRLDLNDRQNHPFSLDMEVEVNLAQLPAVLTHLIKSDPIKKEIAQIHNVSGTALGILTLNKKGSGIETKVAISRFNLHADYRRLPYPVKISGGLIIFSGTRIELKHTRFILKSNEFSDISATLDWRKALDLQVEAGSSRIDMGQIKPWISSFKTLSPGLKTILPISGVVKIAKGSFRGNILIPESWNYELAGEIKAIRARLPGFPGPVHLMAGKFKKTEGILAIEKIKMQALDASLTLSGEVKGFPGAALGSGAGKVGFDGMLGPEAVRWASRIGRLPAQVNLRPPVSITGAKLAWDKKKNVTISGNISVKNGPVVGVNLLKTPAAIRIKRLSIKDDRSQVFSTAKLEPERLSLTFKGNLDGRTLDAFLTENQWRTGSLSGEFEASVPIEAPIRSTLKGSIEADGFSILFRQMPPIRINRLSLTAQKDLIRVNSADLIWEDQTLSAKGDVTLSPEGVRVDADLSTDGVDWKNIQKILEKEKRKRGVKTDKKTGALPLRGKIRFKANHFKYDRFTWRPLHATISFEPGSIDIALENATLCGISTPGTIRVSKQGVHLDVQPVSRDLPLQETLVCLEEERYHAEGTLDLEGNLSGMVQAGDSDAIRSINGSLTVVVRKGRIHKLVPFSRLLELINIADVLKNDLPDPSKDGFAFKKINTKWKIKNGKLILENGKLNSSAMELACKGNINLVSRHVTLSVLVAPLQNTNYIISKIPVLGYILGERFIAIPFKVEGPMGNVTVTPVSATTLLDGLPGVLGRTLKAPFKIIQPITPPDHENQPDIHK